MCSVVGLKTSDGVLVGANYDFRYGHGLVYLGTRDVRKWTSSDDGETFRWCSTFGSVTLVQFGCELPTCGMNEAGLAIHLLEQRDAIYPELDANSAHLNELQWIQYHLDTCATVSEVVAALETVQVEQTFIKLHYAIGDASGDFAFIDFVEGEALVTRIGDAPSLVVTNHAHRSSEESFQRRSLGEKSDFGPNRDSISRYCRLRSGVDGCQDAVDPERCLRQLLDEAAIQPSFVDRALGLLLRRPLFMTFWQTIFEPRARRFSFQLRDSATRTIVDLAELDFSAEAGSRIADLAALPDGSPSEALQPYSRELNESIVRVTYRPFADRLPPEAIEFLIGYPESFSIA